MLKKIFKTIFIMSLCVGISLPTNAAVSVSDGSAFVTKAEFAADLNNLSNRMAQLENSLDAKIDSLVSSYLTRNGIWNGAKQTVDNTIIYDFSPISVPISNYKGSYNDLIISGSWIPNVNKSGMLSFNYQLSNKNGNNTNDTRWGYHGTMQSSSNAKYDNGLLVSFELYLNSLSSSPVFGNILFSAIGIAEPAGGDKKFFMCSPLPASPIVYTSNIFVSKGDNVYFGIREVVHFQSTNVTSILSANESVAKLTLDDEPLVY